MNRFLRFASLSVIATLLLTACVRTPAVSTTPSNTTTAITTTTTVTTPSLTTVTPPETKPPITLPQTTPPITHEPPPKTEPLPPETVVYPTWEGHEDIQLLAAMDGELGEVTQISRWGSEILFSFARWNPDSGTAISAHARLLDLTTGELSAPVPLSVPESTVMFLENGKICLYNPLACIAEVYNREGEKLYSFVGSDPSATLYIDPAGDGTVWCYSWDSEYLTRIPLGGESAEQIVLPGSEGGYIADVIDGIVYYSAWDGDTDRMYTISPDGTVSPLSVPEQYYWGSGCFYTDRTPHRIIDPKEPETVYLLPADYSFTWVANCHGDHLLVERFTDGEGEISSYVEVLDYRSGVYYPSLAADPSQIYLHWTFAEEGVLYFVVSTYDETGNVASSSLCRWNYLHDGEAIEVEVISTETIEDENSKIAHRIEDRWGVQVYYQPHLLHLVASDYSAAAVTDPDLLRDHLLQLEQALSAYPDGFFADLCYGSYTHLEIYLCGKFTPLTPGGITTAEAIANTRGSAMVIGVNVNYLDGEYTRVLAHELCHIMERRLDQIDVDILAEWIPLTPGGHDAYYYSYHHDDGSEMKDYTHTYFYENDPTNAYFVDAYSKSFPTEDRARIFEKLMESGGDPYFADSPVLMAKAQTLCRLIRQYFPSVAATEHAYWEIR
ncbi:MAG: hypothetical protein J6R82_07530 [Clostridia bacterium]|nr:hypothetical protein [Clostridia bacterium]